MTTSTRKDTGALPETRPPERSRRGRAAAWIFVAVVAVLALGMFGFLVDGGVEEAPAALDRPDGVLLDGSEDLGN